MPPEGIDERSHTAPADERHHDVDRICGRNLSTEFVADGGLAGRIGEDGRVEQGGEWARDRLGPPVRESLKQRDQHTPGIKRRIAIEVVHVICESWSWLSARLRFVSPLRFALLRARGRLPSRRCRRYAVRHDPRPQHHAARRHRRQAFPRQSPRATPQAAASATPRAGLD